MTGRTGPSSAWMTRASLFAAITMTGSPSGDRNAHAVDLPDADAPRSSAGHGAGMIAWISALILYSCYAAIVPATHWLDLCDNPRKQV